MKKRMTLAALIIAALMLALCCTACGEDAEKRGEPSAAPTEIRIDPDLAGTYRLIDGTGISQEELEVVKKLAELVIRDDNTGTLTMSSRSAACTFDPKEKKAIIGGANVASYTLDGDRLTIDMGQSGTQVWEKTK